MTSPKQRGEILAHIAFVRGEKKEIDKEIKKIERIERIEKEEMIPKAFKSFIAALPSLIVRIPDFCSKSKSYI